MGKKTILDVRVNDVEKRRYPTKHYVYILEVSWSEGSFTTIYRKYSNLFEFQCTLLEMFPEEAGAKDPTQRMIPFLPGKKMFGRSQIRAVAEKRKDKIDEYCRALIRLPSKISDSLFVQDFFEVRQSDLEIPQKSKAINKEQPKEINEISGPIILERYVALADYAKQKKNECSVKAGQTVEVIDKNENGWWFVNVDDFHEGWMPATYLDPLYGTEDSVVQKLEEEETWITMSKYEAKYNDEISFEKGVLVEVFEKGIDGWWKTRYQGQEGMAPAAYLQRYQGQGVGLASTGAQVVGTLQDATDTNHTSSSSFTLPLNNKSYKPPSSSSTFCSATITSSLSTTNSLPSASKSLTVNSTKNGTKPKGSSPVPKPRPLKAAAAQKPKSAPTWHSQANFVDDEPIYAPTPRRCSFTSSLKKKNSSSFSSSSEILEPIYDIIPEPEAEVYMTIAEFTATADDGVSFQSGRSCLIVTKNANGWWYVDMDGDEGWVPASYLEPISLAKMSDDNVKMSSSKPPFRPQPFKEKPKKKEQPKEAFRLSTGTELRKEPVKEAKKEQVRCEPPKSRNKRDEPSHFEEKRKLSVSKSADFIDGPVPSLKKSANSHTALNDSVKTTKTNISLTKSPPPRPRGAPMSAIEKSAIGKSPKLGSKPTISSPLPLRVSPSTKKVSENLPIVKNVPVSGASIGSNTVTSTDIRELTAGFPKRLSGTAKETPIKTTRNSIDTSKQNAVLVHSKKHTNPEIVVGPLQDGDQWKANEKRSTDSFRPPECSLRQGSTSTASSTNYKSELGKMLVKKTSSHPLPTTDTGPAQPPNRSSYPTKTPATKSSSTVTKTPPGRPPPPKTGTAKKLPPPVVRPSTAPSKPKRASCYVTIGDYTGEGTNSCLSFDNGRAVEVIEKNTDGWWFVKIGDKEGWAPSTYIEESKISVDGGGGVAASGGTRPPYTPRSKPVAATRPPIVDQHEATKKGHEPAKHSPHPPQGTSTFYRAIDSYDEDSRISLVKGRVYELIEESDDGWWLMKDGDIEGWAPSNYFKHL